MAAKRNATERRSGSPHWLLAGLWLALVFPSTASLGRYLGPGGAAVYAVVVAVVLFVAYHTRARWLPVLTERRAMWLTIVTLVVVGLLFAVIYPIANAPAPGRGSDNDDAIVLGAQALMQGRNPYQERTYLGNPVDSMVGGLLLATPFVLAGIGALQNIFWLVMFSLAMRFHLNGWRGALLLLWCMLGLAPAVLHGMVIGNSQIANTLYVLLAILLLMTIAPQPRSILLKMLVAVFLGVALASRANFLMLTPLIFAGVGYRAGWRLATGLAVLTLAVFLALNLPLYLLDPAGFMPIASGNVLARLRPLLPFADTIIIVLTGVVSLALATRPLNRVVDWLHVHSACVLITPPLCGVVLVALASGGYSFNFADYGIFALFFGATGCWGLLWRHWVDGGVD